MSKAGAYTLGIDTASGTHVIVYLSTEGDGIVAERTVPAQYAQSEKLLPAIEELLAEAGAERADIGRIEANPGPGPFTATRVGVATANAVGYALGVPVHAADGSEQPGELLQPVYDQEPNIILKNKKIGR